MNILSTYCKIKNNSIQLNGITLFEGKPDSGIDEFEISAYRNAGINYPKFFKMDALCKLAFLASEYLLKENTIFEEAGRDQIGIVLSNRASSLDTDRKHAASFADKSDYFPSPSVFVYTLPNIMIGEICIRHKITGENAFFLSEKFDPILISSYVNNLLDDEIMKACIGGWVELDGPAYEAFVYLAVRTSGSEKNANFRLHTAEGIDQLRCLRQAFD